MNANDDFKVIDMLTMSQENVRPTETTTIDTIDPGLTYFFYFYLLWTSSWGLCTDIKVEKVLLKGVILRIF
jgi:hypothetical protein